MLVSSTYERAISEIDRLGRHPLDAREVLVDRFQGREDREQRRPRQWFKDEAAPFLSQDRLTTRQFHIPRNPQRLVASVSEQADVPFGVRRALVFWHRLYIC